MFAAGRGLPPLAWIYASDPSALPIIRFDEWRLPPSPWAADKGRIRGVADAVAPQDWQTKVAEGLAMLYGTKREQTWQGLDNTLKPPVAALCL
jgi:hypothetical protein